MVCRPEITLEFDMNYGFRDIVADRFDAGVRMGNTIDKDMIAVPIGPPLRMAVAAAPAYFAEHPPPRVPQDLTVHHRCINQRMPTSGGLYVWDFERRGRKVNVRVEGPSSSTRRHPRWTPRSGAGVALLPEDELMDPSIGHARASQALSSQVWSRMGLVQRVSTLRAPSLTGPI
jgi:DNA-binding transcriptional LysR family regulator